MGEHGVSLENMGNMETMEKMGKHQPDDLKVTRRLLKEKSKLTFVDKDIHCMFVEGKPRTVFFLQALYLRHLLRRLKKS